MLKRAGRLLLELLIVFVGVYAAFALNMWREDRREDARREQIVRALRSHVAWVDRDISRSVPLLDSLVLTPLLDSLEAGEQPALRPLNLNAGDIGTGLWEALLQSGGLDVLDAQTVEMMHRYFAGFSFGVQRVNEFKEQTNNYIYPHLDEGPSAFYDPATGRLRPSFLWYPQQLRRLLGNFHGIDERGDEVLAHLDSLLAAH